MGRNPIPASWKKRSWGLDSQMGLEPLPKDEETRRQLNWEAQRLGEKVSGGEWDFAETLPVSDSNLRLVGTTRAN